MTPATPLQAQRMARVAVSLDRVRLANSLRAIEAADGFARTVEIVQAELQSLAAEIVEQGGNTGGWIG